MTYLGLFVVIIKIGMAYSDGYGTVMCPQNSYITGFYPRTGCGFDNIQVVCSDGSILNSLGGSGGVPRTNDFCSTGFSGMQRYYTTLNGCVSLADLVPYCNDGPGYLSNLGNIGFVQSWSCTSIHSVGGIWTDSFSCPEGQFINGVSATSSQFRSYVIGTISFICDSFSPTSAPTIYQPKSWINSAESQLVHSSSLGSGTATTYVQNHLINIFTGEDNANQILQNAETYVGHLAQGFLVDQAANIINKAVDATIKRGLGKYLGGAVGAALSGDLITTATELACPECIPAITVADTALGVASIFFPNVPKCWHIVNCRRLTPRWVPDMNQTYDSHIQLLDQNGNTTIPNGLQFSFNTTIVGSVFGIATDMEAQAIMSEIVRNATIQGSFTETIQLVSSYLNFPYFQNATVDQVNSGDVQTISLSTDEFSYIPSTFPTPAPTVSPTSARPTVMPSSMPSSSPVTQYGYTGSEGSFSVPANAYAMTVSMYASKGGDSAWGNGDVGGPGGYLAIQVPVSAGNSFTYYVGGIHDNRDSRTGCWGGSGGGYTYLKYNSNFLAIAGGGGGAGESKLSFSLIISLLLLS